VEVHARTLINFDTRWGYQFVFTSLFDELERVSGKPVQWKHIHHTGIEAVTVDMCPKQALGK